MVLRVYYDLLKLVDFLLYLMVLVLGIKTLSVCVCMCVNMDTLWRRWQWSGTC